MSTTTSPGDHIPEPELNASRDDTPEENQESQTIWMRLLFMVIFLFLYGVSRVVVTAVVVLQFFWVLFTDKPNVRLSTLGESLATYTYQIICYLTFNTEERPFPIDRDWPQGPAH